jgi:leucyl/phenylalanyl-tRNA--protein transferase
MPIYRLKHQIIFPNPELADEDGILAIGGDLSPERLLLAYSNGIFPWFSENEPIIWWSPDPRFILFPEEIKVSKSMSKLLKRGVYSITFDNCFRDVISHCANLRTEGTWITPDMIEAYCKLNELGFAHSVETWFEGKLVGGLYGISLGVCFFGESMFSTMSNASKAALIVLTEQLKKKKFLFIDCQVHTNHLESLGAKHISRKDFLELLYKGLEAKTLRGSWSLV